MSTEDHVLWVHYRADIRSQKEFAFHFNGAYNEMQSLMKDYSEILPKLQADFPVEKKQQNHIGFR
jgi:mRNA-degrading endonuclease YafQ of YafQ-DinJ toxin-antitoxin module